MLKLLFAFIAVFSIPKSTPDLANERFEIYLQKDLGWIVKERSTGRQWTYQPVFAVLTSSKDPKLAMRPAGIENVIYSVATWERESLKEEDRLQREKTDSNQIGDGFDDRIFKGRVDRRTPDLFKSGNLSTHRPRRYRKVRDAIVFSFTEREGVNLSASLHFPKENSFPTLKFSFTVTEEKWNP